MFQSLIPAHNTDATSHGRILPSEIPSDAAPLEGADHLVQNHVTYKNRVLHEGKNMFVSLLTGEIYVGLVQRVDIHRVTVGQSAPFPEHLVESAREV